MLGVLTGCFMNVKEKDRITVKAQLSTNIFHEIKWLL
jgi:hypothetical protein